MKYRGLEFTPDELASFKAALDGTPTERLLRDIVQAIRNEAKVELQKTSLSLEAIRVKQGVIEGLIRFKDIVKDLLEIDVEELAKIEVENDAVEVEDEDAGNFDF